MIGATLTELRDQIDALASADGDYFLVCGRTGERPVPVAGKRFAGRETGRTAARTAHQYRAALRRYDPQVPHYDLIVCQDAEPLITGSEPEAASQTESEEPTNWTLSEPAVTSGRPSPERRKLVEFCHSAAAAVLETLPEDGYEGVETAVMDAYFDLAETIADPDDLCVCLLENMAIELDDRLQPADQAAVLASAATRLSPAEPTEKPVSTTLSILGDCGLIGGYTRSPWSTEIEDGTRSIVVWLSEYALTPLDDQFPVLPIMLELYRHQPDWLPSSVQVVADDDGWRLTLVQAREAQPSGLASVPIHPDV